MPAAAAASRDRIHLGWKSHAALALCVIALQVALARYFLDFHAVFGAQPLRGDDFDVHIGQVNRVVEGLLHWGHSWVYDPKLLAGQPEGTIFDADNKAWELWTFAWLKLGVPQSVAFNSFVLFWQLLAPGVVYLAARLFRLGAFASLVASAMASSLWFFDSFAHWVWWIGMTSYAAASVFWLLPLALFHRFMESRRASQAVGCGLLLGIAHLLHPYSFFMLAPPFALLYLRTRTTLARRDHVAVLGIVLATLAINAYWLLNAWRHWRYVQNSAYFGQTGLRYLVADFFSVLLNPTDTGVIGTRTGFRFLFLAMAAAALVIWRRARDPRYAPLATALFALLAFAYLGAYFPYAGQVQPYRHVLPAAYAATIPAAFACEWLLAQRILARATRGAKTLAGILALVALQHLASDVLYFMPSLVPEVPVLIDGTPSPITAYGYLSHFRSPPQHFSFALPRDPGVESQYDSMVDWTRAHVSAGQRVLVDSAVLGERIAWQTDVEVIGGFRERNIAHARANMFRRFAGQELSEQTLGAYLAIFAIDFVIVHRDRPDLARATDSLESLGVIHGWHVYKSRLPVTRFLRGGGELRASTNQLEVSASDPTQELLLSYHFHEALRCQPGCALLDLQVPFDDVGFLLIPAPHPARFTIRNVYP
jgi:hypothetical protein